MMKMFGGDVTAAAALTRRVLAVVLVELHQDRRRNHQEVSEGHGDGVGHHREPLTQPAQALRHTHTQVMNYRYCINKLFIYLILR